MLIALPSPQVLEISGPDAVDFAHAQFSSDVRSLQNSHWQWSAWLSAQGRVRAFFQLLRIDDERLRLLLREGSAVALKAALATFVFRAKTQLQAVEGLQLVGSDSAAEVLDQFGALPTATDIVHTNAMACFSLSGSKPRWLILGETAAMLSTVSSNTATEQWRATDILAGLVSLNDDQSGQFLPTWLGLDRRGAVSVDKGCYPGQEIVARMHFKGGNKRWLYLIEFTGANVPLRGLTLTTQSDLAVSGVIVNAVRSGDDRGIGLAVLPETEPGTLLTCTEMPTIHFRVVSQA